LRSSAGDGARVKFANHVAKAFRCGQRGGKPCAALGPYWGCSSVSSSAHITWDRSPA
jgi:hypothetical protein